jgi:hypothetical protein
MKKYTARVTAKTIEQNLPSDHRKAIAGFIWNGFDAGATEVRLDFQGTRLAICPVFRFPITELASMLGN